jgi:cytoskeleton-associated protein 5
VQREQEASGGADADAGDADAGEAEPAAPMDPRDLLDPVDVYKLFPSDLDERLASSKWKDRFESLEEVNKVLSAPANAKISEANLDAYGSLATTLGAKCKSDANVNVVIEAAKVIEALANGLGKPFGRYRGAAMMGMLERLKERKATVVEALGKALDAVFTTVRTYAHRACWSADDQVPFSEIVDDVLISAKSKNPQVKEGTLRFLQRSLCATTDLPTKEQIKPLAQALVALLGDSAEPVRSGAADCLGTMMKLLGERTFNPYIENVAELQMTKVKDAFEKAEIKYKAGGAKAPAKAPAVAKAAPIAAKKVSRILMNIKELTCSLSCLRQSPRRMQFQYPLPRRSSRRACPPCRTSFRASRHLQRRVLPPVSWLVWA